MAPPLRSRSPKSALKSDICHQSPSAAKEAPLSQRQWLRQSREEAQTCLCLSPRFTPFEPDPTILTPGKTCMPIYTRLPLGDSDAVDLGSAEKEREGRRAFVEAHFRSHVVLQGRPEIDMILLTGTWIAPAKVYAASISYLETIRGVITHFNMCASRIFSNNLNVSFIQGSQMLSSCNSLKKPALYCEEERKNLYHCPWPQSVSFTFR